MHAAVLGDLHDDERAFTADALQSIVVARPVLETADELIDRQQDRILPFGELDWRAAARERRRALA